MFAAEDFEAGRTTFAIPARVVLCLEVGCITGWFAVMSDPVPVTATRSRTTLSIAVSRLENSVLRWGGKGDGCKGSDDNEELHSVKKNKISIK